MSKLTQADPRICSTAPKYGLDGLYFIVAAATGDNDGHDNDDDHDDDGQVEKGD